ncbi:biopolymer transporter ExbD [Granulicella sp. 5B5]|uniref:ExbD/TolR family protein n=1 Tax=Granulicella sp. 5B5 TaxID=1617967 RepID=UPI0015F4CE7A|nr:biopolymer transporter ExbD [Granulicella sp. 5B5]QMV18703.1 biopolymer transporter ExbD [Granulicella sp. 5B5]
MAFSASASAAHTGAEINVTPLIDVLLVLFILFMVIVPQHQRGLDSAIPQGKASTASLPLVTVQVMRHGPQLPVQYFVDQRVVPMAELQSLLQSMFAVRQDHTLIVQADRDLSYQQVATVVSLGRLAGAQQIALNALHKP